ncbi:MAG: hypothetical protein JW891_12610 [Candidatus Lokiarchaeota archaeon]|nr:hypothetical protein [Candidatus Lokiarchaeota archaeon]
MMKSEQLISGTSFFKKKKLTLKEGLIQISDIFAFDFKKNLKLFIFMVVVAILMFIGQLTSMEIGFSQGIPLPEEPIEYIKPLRAFLTMFITISSAIFGGSIIAEDFGKNTGNLLFPKTTRTRLFLGRTILRYTLIVSIIILYYVLIASITFAKYEKVPAVLWNSMGWELLYALMVFSLGCLYSSMVKSTAFSVIFTVFLMVMGFNLIFTFIKAFIPEFEPLYNPAYYQYIIYYSLIGIPDPRYEIYEYPGATYYSWTTPSELGALFGMSIFTAIMLFLALIRFQRRQIKN